MKYAIIENNLQDASKSDFLKDFGYVYAGDESMPPKMAPDGALRGLDSIVISDITSVQNVNAYIRNDIVKNIPDWAKDAVADDVVNFVSPLFGSRHTSLAVSKYDRSISDPGQNKVFQVQAVMYYGNIDAPNELGDMKTYFLMHYCGVGYWTE